MVWLQLTASRVRATQDPVEVASNHDQGYKGHDTGWEYLPGLLEAWPHHWQKRGGYTWNTKSTMMSSEESRLIKLPSKENSQRIRKKKRFCIPKPIDDAKTGLTGSWVCTKYRTRADMPPTAKDFWLPLFIYPITPPATKFKGKTISSCFFFGTLARTASIEISYTPGYSQAQA